ncbi:alkylhydroperoxidase family enzyme [Mycolicibacterium sp. BK634]|uniref:carboxymuconolactone decarboxylase family protein n=1 Tax=Mycolicibacterium sp. BK634 TaxID=2587099 RepID=UPI0016172D03|nr:carboxymuconolactone decarboxylase family protein [Mycolicibacterium sp. BK634]MBB3753781.1 alkylhydroperoxidase family enzyme [Mycolicibacterium sp. BK634]
MTQMTQGPWTRIRPLQSDDVDPKTAAAIKTAEITWGGFPNNLVKVMAYCPRFVELEVEYANSFMFDPVTMVGDVQTAGFNDRFLKELVISRTSLINRSRYSVTHHSFVGMALFNGAGRGEEGHQKLLYLDEHENHPEVYTELERAALNYTAKVTRDAHTVTDQDFTNLRSALAAHNREDERLSGLDDDAMGRHVDRQVVELTWLIGHFCLLNRWFTVLQVPDEGPDDEADFGAVYREVVPADIRERNERILGNGF